MSGPLWIAEQGTGVDHWRVVTVKDGQRVIFDLTVVNQTAGCQAAIGTERVVVIQPTTYGVDNTLHLDAMTTLGHAARGVMVINRLSDPRSKLGVLR